MPLIFRLDEGKTVAGAYEFAKGITSNYRGASSNSMMQAVTRALGPVQNQGGPAAVVNTVAATPESIAERLDLRANAARGLTSVMSCGFRAMGRTYTVQHSSK